MNGGRIRAGLVIIAVAIGSAVAGAAIDHAVMLRYPRRFRSAIPFGSGPEAAARRRADMLARLTTELDLQPAQRTAIDSIMRHTDSALRAVRLQAQPQVRRILDSSRAAISSRLDSAQRDRYAKRRPSSHFRLSQ